MGPVELAVRNAVYARFVTHGLAPSAAEIGAALGLGEGEARAAYRRLHDAHALVLLPDDEEVWMLQPFSAVETSHEVEAAGRHWFANCAWDALGIPAALHADARVESVCADCGERVELEVRDGRLVRGAELLVHVLVPARRWWDDIGFT
jgi:hypothetical protein